MKPLGISQNALARALKVPPQRINEIVYGKRAVTVDTADTALRLFRHFGTSPEFWLNMQRYYEMGLAEDAGLIGRLCPTK